MNKKIPKSELYLVSNNEENLLFVPLREEIYVIDPESADAIHHSSSIMSIKDGELRRFLLQLNNTKKLKSTRDEPIEKISKLSFIPNNICNLSCSYCYSASGRNQSVIDEDKLKVTLDWFIKKSRVGEKPVSIFITGGGEPLATWGITSLAIEYASLRASEQNIELYLSIITNGTLITEEKIKFLKRHKCKIGVSFDVLEELQNLNRGMYEKVDSALKLLQSSKMNVMINTTVTPSSVNKMVDIVRTVIERYSFITQFTMEPVTASGLFASAAEVRSFYETFFESYLIAKELADNAGLNLRFTLDDSLRGVAKRHCPGKFVLTPSGKISVCHLVSSPLEKRFKECIYGEIRENTVVIDHKKFNELYSHNVFAYSECSDCIAKWSCGGECYTRRATYPKDFLEEVCRFNRRVVEYNILNYLRKD